MNAKRLMVGSVIALMVASAAGGGIKIAGELSQRARIGSSIAEQLEMREEVRQERERFHKEIDRVAKETRELPDSLRATATKRALEASFNMAKAEAVLDQKELRAEKRQAYFEEQQVDSMRRIKRWGAALGIVEIVLGVGVFLLIRR